MDRSTKKVTKLISSQMFWWSVGRIYQLPMAVAEHIKPGIRTQFIFNLMKGMHKKMNYNPVDSYYWKDQGWI